MKTMYWVLTVCVMLSFASFAEASRHEGYSREGRSSNEIKIYGLVEALPESGLNGIWQVGGREIVVHPGTRIKEKYGRVGLGAYVEAEGSYDNRGSIQAYEIEVKGSSSSTRR